MKFRANRVVTLCLASVTLSSPAMAQSNENTGSIDCALIRDGVQRLTCYDAQRDPQSARDQASEESLEHARQRAEQLVADKETRKKQDRKSTRLNSSHVKISYAVFCLKKI